MLANRPYRAALTPEQAGTQLVAGGGSQFDERVVGALVAMLDAEPARVSRVGRAA
jgi:HD-GYP domain-containing protein (c-di-GMP phosphodiesterase class II)